MVIGKGSAVKRVGGGVIENRNAGEWERGRRSVVEGAWLRMGAGFKSGAWEDALLMRKLVGVEG